MPYKYESKRGDRLTVSRCDNGHVLLVVTSAGGNSSLVCIEPADVAEVTAEMHANADQCEFCRGPGPLVAVLAADTDQRVCAECHADPRVPTQAHG